MRKISIVLLFSLISMLYVHAQSDYYQPTGNTTSTTSQLNQDDGTGNIGIGIGSLVVGDNVAFGVSNHSFLTIIPPILLAAGNQVPSTGGTTGMSAAGIASLRLDASGSAFSYDFICDANGLVGIGNFPSYYGNYNINAHLYVTDNNNDGYALIGAYTYSNLPALIVDKNGLVGVGNFPGIGGVYNPSCPMCYVTPGNGVTNAHLFVTDQNGDGYPLLATYTNTGNPALTILGSGYVGIGTATPVTPLDVYGNAKFENDAIVEQNFYVNGTSYLWGNSNTYGAATFASTVQMSHGAANGYVLQSDASGNASWVNPNTVAGAGLWTLASNGTDMYNTNTGNIGIGTNTPQATLDVQGTVRIGNLTTSSTTGFSIQNPFTDGGYSLYVQYGILTERVKVALTGGGNWSDYVFDKDYKLPQLNEVKEYIAKNHHLPGVPSADDVSCDGIDLGSMDATLLKKIEELTLYVLELKNENEDIRMQIAKK